VATESRAERRHPPETVGHGVMQRTFEHEKNGRAAQVAEFAQHGGAVANVGFRQAKLVPQRQQHVASAGVQNPAGDAIAFHAGSGERFGKKFRGFVTGDLRDLRQQNVSQHPVFVIEPERVAFVGSEARRTRFPFDAAAVQLRFIREHRRARAVAKEARADEHAGIVIKIKRRAANFDADGQDFSRAAGGKQSFRRAQIGQGRAAALADEIECEHIRTQTEPFADIAGETGTQIAGASADEHGVNFIGFAVRVLQRVLRGLGGQCGRVLGETGVERVGRQIENFGNRFQRQVTGGDAVVAAEHFLENGARPRREPGEWRGFLHRVPAFALGVALGRGGNSESDNEHNSA